MSKLDWVHDLTGDAARQVLLSVLEHEVRWSESAPSDYELQEPEYRQYQAGRRREAEFVVTLASAVVASVGDPFRRVDADLVAMLDEEVAS